MKQPTITIYYKKHKMKVTPISRIKKRRTTNMNLNSSNCKLNTKNVINLVSSDEEDNNLSDDSDKTVIIGLRPSVDVPKSESQETFSNVQSVTSEKIERSTDVNDSHFDVDVLEIPLNDSNDPMLTINNTSESPAKHCSKKISTPPTSPKKKRFYSPTKKRNINECTPNKRKNLASMFEYESDIESSPPKKSDRYDEFVGLDTKTKFLLDIINVCLNDDSMKNLLDEEAQAMLYACRTLSVQALRVVCRLYWRREGWYRKNKIMKIIHSRNDIILIEQILKTLTEQHFLKQGDPDEVTMNVFMTEILKMHELKNICNMLKLKTTKKKKAELQQMLEHYCKTTNSIVNCLARNGSLTNEARILEIMNECAGPCYKLSEKCHSVFYRLYLLSYLGIDYSIIRDKNLEYMLLNAVTRRETYPMDSNGEVDNAGIVFESRPHFESYVSAHHIYEEFFGTKNVESRCNIVKQIYNIYKKLSGQELERYKLMPTWLRKFTPGYLFVKIFCEGLVDLKKGKNISQCELAVEIITSLLNQDLFRQNRRAQWFDEKALILHTYLHKSNEAAKVLLEGFSSNLSEEEKDILRRRAKYLATLKCITLDVNIKKLLLAHAHVETTLESSFPAKHVYKQPMENQTKGKLVYETRLHSERTMQFVEDYAINYYMQTGEFTHGSHWESRIVVTLFTLIFWDIIYSTPPGVRGVFLNRYQQLPLDMYTEAFYTNRKTIIDKRLELIEHRSMATMLELLEFNWNSRPTNEVSGVNRTIGWENLAAVVSCLGPKGVHVLCRRLARQYHYAHSGFPDLTLWNIHTKKVKFVEVKSDSDSPSMKQIQWMQYLIANGIDTEFCYVGTKTHRRSRQRGSSTNESPLDGLTVII